MHESLSNSKPSQKLKTKHKQQKTKEKSIIMKVLFILQALLNLLTLLIFTCQQSTSATTSNRSDQQALLNFKSQIQLPSNNQPLSNWNTTTSLCNWIGITCSRNHQGRVTSLNLSYMQLQGTISPSIGNLSFLGVLDLRNNSFHGTIPESISKLRRLRVFILMFNKLQGTIPSTIFQFCTRLQSIHLRSNNFHGHIPNNIGNLSNLVEFNLQFNRFEGKIPPPLFNISSIKSLALTDNRFFGGIPMNICHLLPNLHTLFLSQNPIGGQIPSSLCFCRDLERLELMTNKLTGSLPRDFSGCLTKVWYLNLADNEFVGTIPSSLSNLSSLENLQLVNNYLSGEIPKEFGRLPKLKILNVGFNSLSGRFPQQILNISSIEVIQIMSNNFSGNIPEFSGFKLPKLRDFVIFYNQFQGTIPESISNASMVNLLELSRNFFTGQVPMSFGNLHFLQILNLQHNQLSNNLSSSKELQFITSLTRCPYMSFLVINSNPLKGSLPKSIGNLSENLQLFYADRCQIQGKLPYEIGNLSRLTDVDFSSNNFIGEVPSSIGNLRMLRRLRLRGNKFEGNIVNDLCSLTSLTEFSLDENKFQGPISYCFGNFTQLEIITLSANAFTSIPETIWKLNGLWFLNFSVNSISGHLSSEVGKLQLLQTLDLSLNNLSGSIPETLSNLKMIQTLNLSSNEFQGSIPSLIGNLGSLEDLDLSYNNFTGIIPKSLEKLSYLKHLNISFNMLSGEVPNGEAFENFTMLSFIGNDDLCGSSLKLKLPPCDHQVTQTSSKKRHIPNWVKYVVPPIVVLIILVASVLVLFMKKRSNNKNASEESTGLDLDHKFITYREVVLATNNFDEANLLGSGSFGSVYKGIMNNEEVVAVKVFNLHEVGVGVAITSSFDRECQVLRNVRHRNVMKVITSCSNLEFRALIFEYMPNGSLEKFLHIDDKHLDFLQRVNIMVDVASGLEYLHHGYSESIVHCDLKPSNVLLDTDMVAHLGDFGISKVLAKSKSMTHTGTIGTFGYIAPEYGVQGRVSTKGDVYSYGIMLLETFSRKSPRDEMLLAEGLNLRQWIINSSFPQQVMEIADISLWSNEVQEDTIDIDSVKLECISSIIELALLCSNDSPLERPNMKGVAVTLNRIKTHYLQTIL